MTDDAAQGQKTVQELRASAHMMVLETGLFCVLNAPPANAHAAASDPLGLPGVRISPAPGEAQDVAISTFRPDGWLSGAGDAALVRVGRGPARVLVTVYQALGAADAPPRLQVLRLIENAPAGAAAPAALQPGSPASRLMRSPPPGSAMAHVQRQGDVSAPFGTWVGEAGSQRWIEGFAIAAPAGVAAEDLTYQAVLGRGWLSPWSVSGQYCGSRGMALPVLGLRVRLSGAAAAMYDCRVSASFIDGGKAGPAGSDEACESPNLSPMEAFQVAFTLKGAAAPKPAKAAKGAKAADKPPAMKPAAAKPAPVKAKPAKPAPAKRRG